MNKDSEANNQRNVLGWIFLIPAIVVFLILRWIPILATAILSFFEWDILTPPKFVGISNYVQLLFHDKLFLKYLSNTINLSIIYLLLLLFLALILAVALINIKKGKSIFRFICLLPPIAGVVSCAFIWRWLYNSDFGLINLFITSFGLKGSEWFSSGPQALRAIAYFRVWFTLGTVVFFLTLAMEGIIGKFQGRFLSIKEIINNIKLPILIILLIGMVNVLNESFTSAFMMTGGGPKGSTTTISYYIYNNTYQWFKIGYGSAISMFLIALFLILGIALIRILEVNRLKIGYKEISKEQSILSNKKPLNLICYIILIIFAVSQIVPFLWMISTSLKRDVFQYPPRWIPSPLYWNNFAKAWQVVPFGNFFTNSILTTIATSILQVIIAYLAAYSLSLLKPKGYRVAFWLILSTIFVSLWTVAMPIFLKVRVMGWIDTYKTLIFPSLAWTAGILLFNLYFDGLGENFIPNLRTKGATESNIFNIVLNKSKRIIAFVLLVSFYTSWHSFNWPLIVTNSMPKKVLPIGLASLQGLYTTDWPTLMAGACINVFPMILIFLLAYKYAISNISIGIKDNQKNS